MTATTLEIIHIKSYDIITKYYEADVLWSTDIDSSHHILIYNLPFNDNNMPLNKREKININEDNILSITWTEIYPDEIDILVHYYKLKKICAL